MTAYCCGKAIMEVPKTQTKRVEQNMLFHFFFVVFSPLIGFQSALRCEPFQLHFLRAHRHELGKKLSTTFGCFQEVLVIRVLLGIVPPQNQGLAQTTKHQEEKGVLFLLVKVHDALPACYQSTTCIQRTGILQHKVSNGNCQLIHKAAVHEQGEVQDAGHLVVPAVVGLHDDVVVTQVSVDHTCVKRSHSLSL